MSLFLRFKTWLLRMHAQASHGRDTAPREAPINWPGI
jgi:hypothetical protein